MFPGFLGMMGGVQGVPMCDVRVMRGCLVITGFMMRCGFAVMLGGVLVMLSGLEMVFATFVSHICLLIRISQYQQLGTAYRPKMMDG